MVPRPIGVIPYMCCCSAHRDVALLRRHMLWWASRSCPGGNGSLSNYCYRISAEGPTAVDLAQLMILECGQLQLVAKNLWPTQCGHHLASDCSHRFCLYLGWLGGSRSVGGITGLAPPCCRSAVCDGVLVWSYLAFRRTPCKHENQVG